MKHYRGWGFRGTLVAAAWGIFASGGIAQAQTSAVNTAPGLELRRQLAELAANPTSVSELVETGRAALGVGDPEGALGFFTRAKELAPRDMRVAAGLAAANVRTGRPETALLLFSEAVALGAQEGEIAGDRGLAYDLLGQTARAQQDYLLSLGHREDAEVRRRLALSLAISGQREAALRLVDEQVRQGDRAGQRARVLVLALSGDARGAASAASASLPAQASHALAPFLTQLASLSPADKASAANLGRVPGGMRQASYATGTVAADPAALAFAGGGAPSDVAMANRLPVATARSDAPRRRAGGVSQVASAPTGGTNTARVLASASTPLIRQPAASSPNRLALPHPNQPLQLATRTSSAASVGAVEVGSTAPAPAATELRLAASQAIAAPAAGEGGPAPNETPTVELAALQPPVGQPVLEARPRPEPEPAEEATDGAAANLAVWNSGAAPARSSPATPNPVSRPPVRTNQVPVLSSPASSVTARSNRPAFSDVVATVSSLSAETAPTSRPATLSTPRRSAGPRQTAAARVTTPAAAQPSAARAARPERATRTAAAAARGAASRDTQAARIWVQLGVSANRAGFTYEINRMRQAAPELRTQTAYTAPIGAQHRLLVGPFPSDTAARTFINTLRQKNIQSMSWTSPAGTDITRLGGR